MGRIAKVDGCRVAIFDTMYDFVKDVDLSYYKTFTGKEIGSFVGWIYPSKDIQFIIREADTITVNEEHYTNVSFKNAGNCIIHGFDAYLKTDALEEPIFVIYELYRHGHKATNSVYEYKEDAEKALNIIEDDAETQNFDMCLIQVIKKENPETYNIFKEYYKEKVQEKLEGL